MHILAIDGTRAMRDMVSVALTSAGMTVTVAEDGIDALAALERIVPDAIISDIDMPRLDGFGFIEAVRKMKHLRAVPILILTSENEPELVARGRRAGATGWIMKPFDPQKLVRTLHAVTG